ncbi:MAG: hypothetical protein ACLR9W_09690 [Enterobacter hormaechei]
MRHCDASRAQGLFPYWATASGQRIPAPEPSFVRTPAARSPRPQLHRQTGRGRLVETRVTIQAMGHAGGSRDESPPVQPWRCVSINNTFS